MSEQSARYQRSARGLVTALGVLVLVVVGWVVFRSTLFPDEAPPRQQVDYRQTVPPARKAADFDLVAPPRLPDGWRATSARFTPGVSQHWHLGLLTDRGRYVGLEQGRASVPDLVEEFVDPAATRGAATRVDGRTWSTYTDSGGDLALVRRQGRTTTLVVGHDVPKAQLVAFTASLR